MFAISYFYMLLLNSIDWDYFFEVWTPNIKVYLE